MNYAKLLSPAANGLKPSGIRRFFDIVESMPDVISLGVGEPDFPTPWHIAKAGVESIERHHTRYTANRGMSELCSEIVQYLDRRFDLSYDAADETLITVGGSEAIDLALRALICPGDEVLVPEPSFVCYNPCTLLAGGVPVAVPTYAADGFKLRAEHLRQRITPRTKALILSYPNNPTGAILDKNDLKEIASILRGTDIFVISDEIYAELTYGGKHVSIAGVDGMRERTVLVSGFSKAFSMTGWRLGYACAPREIISAMTKIHQYAIMCSPTVAQYAGVTAMRDGMPDVQRMAQEYDMRRRVILHGVREIGMQCFEPRGAFYIFPDITMTGLDSETFCNKLLTQCGVAVIPGTAFGASGEGYVRISYAYSLNQINAALKRIAAFMQDYCTDVRQARTG